MSVAHGLSMTGMTIEECQRLDTPLRQDLEVLDYEIRSLVARIRKEAGDAGARKRATRAPTIRFSSRPPRPYCSP
jgi:hypothetical protein